MSATRRLHLGIDYGTAWSKLVLRDYEDPNGDRAYVVRPPHALEEWAALRFPSLVAFRHDRLWFGWEAEEQRQAGATSYSSIKVRAALPNAFPGERIRFPADLSAFDLAVLSVAHLAQIGQTSARELAGRHRASARLSMTLSAPMSQIDHLELRAKFVRISRLAFVMLDLNRDNLANGLPIARARELLRAAATRVDEKYSEPELSFASSRVWVRSEVESAVLWPFQSPSVKPGLYAAVDVGAGTTDASFFRITPGKEGLAIFGAASSPPGVDAIDEAIARPGEDPFGLRRAENRRIAAIGVTRALSRVFDSIFDVYNRAFGRAYEKDRRSDAWAEYEVFVVGGGSRIKTLRAALSRHAGYGYKKSIEAVPMGTPRDLSLLGGGSLGDDADAFGVAYGLSWYCADVPEAMRPSDIRPFNPRATTDYAPTAVPPGAGGAHAIIHGVACVCGGVETCSHCDGRGFVAPRPPLPVRTVTPMATDRLPATPAPPRPKAPPVRGPLLVSGIVRVAAARPAPSRTYKACPHCGTRLRQENYAPHLSRVHPPPKRGAATADSTHSGDVPAQQAAVKPRRATMRRRP